MIHRVYDDKGVTKASPESGEGNETPVLDGERQDHIAGDTWGGTGDVDEAGVMGPQASSARGGIWNSGIKM